MAWWPIRASVQRLLLSVLEQLKLQDNGHHSQAPVRSTTTEFLDARHVYERLAQAARDGKLGREGGDLKGDPGNHLGRHLARAWYEAPLWRSV